MRVRSEQFKIFKINVVKVKRHSKTGDVILLFTVDRGVSVYDRNLDYLGGANYGMNYNNNYIEMTIKF